jgi:hypothetical protein
MHEPSPFVRGAVNNLSAHPASESRRTSPKRRQGSRQQISADSGRLRIPRVYAWGAVTVVAAILVHYCFSNPNQKLPMVIMLSAGTFVLGCFPMLKFLFYGKVHQIPVFEAHCLFYALCFGFAGFQILPNIISLNLDEMIMIKGLQCALVGLTALLAGYYFIGSRICSHLRPLRYDKGISALQLEWLAWIGCGAVIAYDWLNEYLEIGGFGQVLFMVFSLGFYSLITLTLEKKASPLSQWGCFLVLLPFFFFFRSGLATGGLTPLVMAACWISLIFLRTRQRISILLLISAGLIGIICQPIKFQIRSLVSNGDVKLGPQQMIAAYVQGFKEVYGSTDFVMKNPGQVFSDSFMRINHLATTAAILRDTPSVQPFLYGSSYLPLLTKWIPRAVWPNKPKEQLGNDWAHNYGYLYETDNTTSFNLPWLPEMYMNFGWGGVVGIMFLLGILYRAMWVLLMEQPQTTAEYAVGIVFAQTLVFAESNLSLMLGAPIIFGILVWVISKFILPNIVTAALPMKRRRSAGSAEQGRDKGTSAGRAASDT